MTIEATGEAYVGEYSCGKESGYGYVCRQFDQYEVQEQKITTLDKTIPAYETTAMYEGEMLYYKD